MCTSTSRSLIARFKGATFVLKDGGCLSFGSTSVRFGFARQIRREISDNPTGQQLLLWFREKMKSCDQKEKELLEEHGVNIVIGLFADVVALNLSDSERKLIAAVREQKSSEPIYREFEDETVLYVHILEVLDDE